MIEIVLTTLAVIAAVVLIVLGLMFIRLRNMFK
jgi:hypothetical protein